MPENRARQTIAAANGIATDRTFGAVAPPLYLSTLLRLSVGLEAEADLINDLRNGLSVLRANEDGKT